MNHVNTEQKKADVALLISQSRLQNKEYTTNKEGHFIMTRG